jgi:adenylate kinase family enzyme
MSDIPERIHIVGGPATGKSYLASQLSERLDYPHIELDQLYWDGGFSTRNTAEERERLLEDAIQAPQWIIEGAYCSEWVRPAFEAADVIVSLRMSALLQGSRTALRLSRRVVTGQTNFSQSLALLRWIDGFERQYADEFPHDEYDSKTITLLSRTATNAYMKDIGG